jgi:hypothetical protein
MMSASNLLAACIVTLQALRAPASVIWKLILKSAARWAGDSDCCSWRILTLPFLQLHFPSCKAEFILANESSVRRDCGGSRNECGQFGWPQAEAMTSSDVDRIEIPP